METDPVFIKGDNEISVKRTHAKKCLSQVSKTILRIWFGKNLLNIIEKK